MSVASSRMEGLEIFTTPDFTIVHVETAALGCPGRAQLDRISRRRKAGEQTAGLAEPWAFAAPIMARHGRFVFAILARGLPSLGGASLRLQKQRVVVVVFGVGGNPGCLAKHGVGCLGLRGLRMV